MKKKKRAWVPGGGGPGCGPQIGALARFGELGMDRFDVVSASCIGAWVVTLYYSLDGTAAKRVQDLRNFFVEVFRPDDVHDKFPIPTPFAPDLQGNAEDLLDFLRDPRSYQNLFVPREIMRVWEDTLGMVRRGKVPHRSDVNMWWLRLLSAHPVSRFMTAIEYRSKQNGKAQIYYEGAPLLEKINWDRLWHPDRPEIRFNAFNLKTRKPELFTNRVDRYGNINARSLCACSALPSVFKTIEIGDAVYCEGATVDTVQFINLLEDHSDLDEIWISRIVDVEQAAAPKDQTGSTANHSMIFAGSLGALNIAAFRQHAKDLGWKGDIIEIEVPPGKWEWSHSNLDAGCRYGYAATSEALLERKLS